MLANNLQVVLKDNIITMSIPLQLDNKRQIVLSLLKCQKMVTESCLKFRHMKKLHSTITDKDT